MGSSMTLRDMFALSAQIGTTDTLGLITSRGMFLPLKHGPLCVSLLPARIRDDHFKNREFLIPNSIFIDMSVCTMWTRARTTRHFGRCCLNVLKGHIAVGEDEAGLIKYLAEDSSDRLVVFAFSVRLVSVTERKGKKRKRASC